MAAVIRRYDLLLIEDNPYALMHTSSPATPISTHVPEHWSGAALELRAREAGVDLLDTERFSVEHEPVPAAVQLSLSDPASLDELVKGLDVMRRILEGRLPFLRVRL